MLYVESEDIEVCVTENELKLVDSILQKSDGYDAALYLKARKAFSLGKSYTYSDDHIRHCYPSLT